METRGRNQDRNGDGSGDGNKSVAEMGTGMKMGTGTGSGRPEKRRRSARNRTKGVYAMWEKEETWLSGKRKKRRQESVGSVAVNPDYLENRKEAGGEHQKNRVSARTVLYK